MGEIFQEVGKEVEDVVRPFVQRRQAQAQGVDAEEQVAPEAAGLDSGDDVGIAGRDDADIQGDDVVRTEAHDLLRFQDAQELRLDARRHAVDFIEEYRPVVGHFKEAGLAFFAGARKGPANIAEELAFQEVCRQGGAVDGHERRVPALDFAD